MLLGADLPGYDASAPDASASRKTGQGRDYGILADFRVVANLY
jgi:hypothetical protein